MKTRKFEIIQCPKCGREYLPAEIFIPSAFFGKPFDVVRDVYGKILDYDGTSVDAIETYTCDKCNTLFQVRAKMTFVVDNTIVGDIDEEYSSPIPNNTLFMDSE